MPAHETKVRKDSRLFAEMCAALVERGNGVQFRVYGESMAPNIANGDEIIVVPASKDDLRTGDVAFIQNFEGLRVHRVTPKRDVNGAIITSNDTAHDFDAPASRVFGRVVVRRRNGIDEPFTPLQTRVVHPLRIGLRRIVRAAELRLRRSSSVLFVLIGLFALAAAPSVFGQALTITNTASPTSVAAGGTITYTQVLSNTSGKTVNANITVTQAIPANTTYVSEADNGTGNWNCNLNAGVLTCTDNANFANNGSNTFTIVVSVNAGVAAGTVISDTVSAKGSNTATASAPATSTVGNADLAVTQTVSAASIPAGSNYTYTEVATNNGPATVPGGTLVVYQQTPPNTTYQSITATGWTCTHPTANNAGPIVCTYNSDLAGSASAPSIVITLKVNSGGSAPAAGTTIVNSATVTSNTTDTDPTNNTSVTSILVEPANTSDLAVTLNVSPTPVFISSALAYTISVQNLGPSAAAATANLVSFTLPTGLTNVTATPPAGWNACTVTATTVTCSSQAIAANTTATITVNATAPSTATTLTGVAAATYASDSNATNNSDTAITVVQPIVCATPGRDLSPASLTGTVNTYYKPTAGTLSTGSISVALGAASGSTTPIASGDLILFIQMQDATINSTNTSSYGDGNPGDPATGANNLASSGVFEFVTATSAVPVGGGTLSFTGTGPIVGANTTPGLLNTYVQGAATTTLGQQTYQVIRVPQYMSTALSSTLTALRWSGSVGGVLAIDVAGQLSLGNSTVSLDGVGFRGAGGRILTGTGTGTNVDYVTLSSNAANGSKGEGIVGTPRYLAPFTFTTTTTATDNGVEGLPSGSYSRGAPGNAGGGGTDGDPVGNSENSGGGGGGNGGTGGLGGYGWNTFGSSNSTNGGFGGSNFPATTSALVMGGGGGAGTTNDGSYYISGTNHNADCAACTGIYSSGGAGGGIAIIHAGSITSTGTISANGVSTASTDNDSTGGGGAGGSIEVFANSGGVSGLTVSAVGGNAGNTWPEQGPGGFPGNRHGPGGGGAGGVAVLSGAPASITLSGGSNGYTNTQQDSFGATSGTDGATTTAHIITETPGTQSGAYCAGADLAVTNVGPADTVAGGTINYAQSIANNGPLDAVNAVFTEATPANTTFSAIVVPAGWTCTTPAVGTAGIISCTNPAVASLATFNFTVSVKVNAGTTTGSQIVDVDNITSGTSDPNLLNNTATSITTVGTATGADIVTTNSASSPTTVAGTNVTMTAIVTNQGPAVATSAGFSETIPANTTFVSFIPPAGWTCFTPVAGGTGTVSCLNSSFASGASFTFPVVLKVTAGTPAGTVISATADGESATPDPNPSNDLATATTIVASSATQADLAITSVATPNPVSPGNNITYAQVLTNNGPGTVTNGTVNSVTFTDTIPTGTTLASFTVPAGWTCTNTAAGATGVVSCSLNVGQTITQGGTVSFPMVVKVNLTTTSGTTITNTANVNVPCSATQDPNCANNAATTSVLVASPTQADVSIIKMASPEPVNQNTNLTYTLQVTNAGPAIAQNVTVTDVIPAQVTYQNSSTSIGTTCSLSGTTVTCGLGNMSVGSIVIITINATANTFGSSSVICNGLPVNSCNTASVTSSTSDPNSANNSSSAGTTIAAPTSVDLSSAHVYIQPDGTAQIEWQTHEESRNLGFHVYREDAAGRHRVNPSIIAGSALQLRGSKPQHAAKMYRWIDAQASTSASYWIEDLDINGSRTIHGPYYAEYGAPQSLSARTAIPRRHAAFENSSLLSTVRAKAAVLPNAPARPNVGRPVAPGSTLNYPHVNAANYSGVKIAVEQEGWYHVTFAQLYAAGLDANSDPRGLHLYAEGVEQPMLITGHPSGPVLPADAVEFYGTGIDTPYSGTRIYWLVRVDHNPTRIGAVQPAVNGSAAPASFPFSVVRQDRTTYFAALLNGENSENFFGAIITSDPVDQDLVVTHSDRSGANPVTLNITLQGAMDQQIHTVDVVFNGTPVGEMIFPNLVQYTQLFPLDPSLLRDGTNTVTLTAQNGENDLSLVENITLQYPHTYAADANWLRATAQAGEDVRISGFTNSQIRVFDITDPLNTSEFKTAVAADANAPGTYDVSLTLPHSGAVAARTILAFSADQMSAPVSLEHHAPSFLDQQRAGADYVLIAHPDFVSNVTPLVRLRESQGHQVSVVTTEQIFDQYNYGERSPFAIRSYLQDAINKWQRKPQSILLVGDASFDPRNYLGFGDLDFVPSRMIQTAAFKTASDDWFTDFAQTGYATIPTGRLPVDSPADTDLVVSKIVGYESGNAAGPWSSRAVVIADQNVDVDFTSAANTLAATIPSSLQVNKILANTLDFNTARAQLLNALNSGSLIVNYDGHGAEQQWSFSNLFDTDDAAALTNGGRLPVYLVMDCLNGFFQDVYGPSLAESLLLAPNGGAVAVWASSGFTNQPPQAAMNLSLMSQLASHPGTPLGQLLLAAKNGVTDNDVRRTWLLFGDPAMKLEFAAPPAIANRTPIVPRPRERVIAPKLPAGVCARDVVCRKGNQQ